MNEEIIREPAEIFNKQQDVNLQESKTDTETIIKCYNYASTKVNKGEIKSSLTVTNLRVIMESKGKRSFERKEIPLQAICYVESSYYKDSKPWGIILFALLMTSICLALAFILTLYFLLACLPFVALTIVYLFKKGETLSMNIYTDKPIYNVLSLSCNSLKSKKREEKLSVTKVFVNISPEARNMLENFGTLIFTLQKELYPNQKHNLMA